MKNIHVLPTNKPSRVFNTNKGEYYFREHYVPDTIQTCKNYNIYITSDEEIKEGDWFFNGEHVLQASRITDIIIDTEGQWSDIESSKKIILTTDQDLIKEGVQSIDDEFLEWFVKNPSCEYVEIENKKVLVGWEPDYTYEYLGIDGSKNVYHNFYKIIIPQEEPKQETLEEAAENYASKKLQRPITIYNSLESNVAEYVGFIEGAKWQSERMYSEEDLHNAFYNGWLYRGENYSFPKAKKEWFEQFKKK